MHAGPEFERSIGALSQILNWPLLAADLLFVSLEKRHHQWELDVSVATGELP